jgi:hypothetical protein
MSVWWYCQECTTPFYCRYYNTGGGKSTPDCVRDAFQKTEKTEKTLLPLPYVKEPPHSCRDFEEWRRLKMEGRVEILENTVRDILTKFRAI